jgi:hypothetical protein
MTTFEKHYIGKGTQVANLDIVKVVLPFEGIEAAVFENKDGVKYLSFEIARLKEADKFGRTHTCYFQTKVQPEESKDKEPAAQPKKKAGKASKKMQSQPEPEDDLPY